MTAADLLAALQPIVEALETLGVPHMLGGSLASSVHGVPRTSIDGDLVADLEPQHVAPLLQRLAGGYYVDEAVARFAATRRGSSRSGTLPRAFLPSAASRAGSSRPLALRSVW